MRQPKIAISLGDPTGIGPEIVARALPAVLERASVVVFGHLPSLVTALEKLPEAPLFREIAAADVVRTRENLSLVHAGERCAAASLSPRAIARAQIDALDLAADAVLTGSCDALVTAPVSKASVSLELPRFVGHTEHLAARCGLGPQDVTMVFANRDLVVGLLSTHVPMRLVPDTVDATRCERTLRHVERIVEALKPGRTPRIGVAALNPHAGEEGLLGDEEREILAPFCEEARRRGRDVRGPVPADTLFRDAFAGAYDGVIAAYHDQAMIPLKLAGFGRAANVTVGLPFVRTSPDHGVAHDIAGRGIADPSGMALAIDIALALIERKTLE